MSLFFAIYLLGWRIDACALLSNLFWPAGFALVGTTLVWLLFHWARRAPLFNEQEQEVTVDHVWCPPQGDEERGEPAGIAAFTPEYFGMYQTGLWLLTHQAEAPYDDL